MQLLRGSQMNKSELLKQIGFSDEYIERLEGFSNSAIEMSPSDFSDGVIHHESSDSNELVLHFGNEGDDSEFKVTM